MRKVRHINIIQGSLILLLLLIAGCSKEEEPIPMTTLLIKVVDANNASLFLDTNLSVDSQVSRTINRNWAEFTVPSNQTYIIRGCVDDANYYDSRMELFVGFDSKVRYHLSCGKKSDYLNVTIEGGIRSGQFAFNVTIIPINGYWRELSLCEDHSPSISYVTLDSRQPYCQNGWENATEGAYRCGETVRECLSIKDRTICVLGDFQRPEQFRYLRNCRNYGATLYDGEELKLSFFGEAFPLQDYDYVKMYIFDNQGDRLSGREADDADCRRRAEGNAERVGR